MRNRAGWGCGLTLGIAVTLIWASALAAAIPTTELQPYVFERPIVSGTTGADDIVAKIRRQAGQIVAANRHDLVGGRLWGTENQLLWGHGRAVASIAQTIPFLDQALSDQVKAYLAVEVNTYLLSATYLNTEVAGSLGTASGVSNFGMSWTANGAFRWEALYGLWAYAHYSGDWTRIQNNWTTIKSIYTGSTLSGQRFLGRNTNSTTSTTSSIDSEIAGLMGMARMARHLHDSATETTAANSAYARLNNKNDEIAAALANPVTLKEAGSLGRSLIIEGYHDLTPDLCRFLAAYQSAKTTTQFNTITDRFRTWYLSDMAHVSDWMSVAPFPPVTATATDRPGEEGFQMSLFSNPICMARTYILQVGTDTLRKELPLGESSRTVPYFLDMFRLQHLVGLAHRYSTITWQAE